VYDKDIHADKGVVHNEEQPSPLEQQWGLWSAADPSCVHQFMSK